MAHEVSEDRADRKENLSSQPLVSGSPASAFNISLL